MSTTKQIIIPAGETREYVLLNEANVDYHFVQQQGSSLRVHLIYLSDSALLDEQCHSSIVVDQDATGCRTELYGMGLLHGTQRAHVLTRVNHNIGGGYSSQLFKFVLDDQSKGSYMLTEPQLEIYADDVKASHGATTGQLDESALFYMQQRCIDRDTAAKLLLCAFFDEVLRTLSDAQLQEELVNKINTIL